MDRIRSLCSLITLAVGMAGAAQAQDSTQTPRMVGPEDLPTYSTVGAQALVPYPADLASRDVTGCVTLAYMIEPDGTTSGFRTLDAAASSRSPLAKRQAIEAFTRAAAAAASTWRYAPVGEARRTLTAAIVEFGPEASTAAVQCGSGDVARALRDGVEWKQVLRDLYETRWRFNTNRTERNAAESRREREAER